MCWKREFPNFLRSPSYPKSLGLRQTLFCIEKMLQMCLCDPLHEVQVAQDCGLCAGTRFHGSWSSCWLFQSSQSIVGLSIGGVVQILTKSHLALKMALQHSFSTSSAKLSLANLQGWEIQPLPAAASVLPSQVMQPQVIGWILSQIYFQV